MTSDLSGAATVSAPRSGRLLVAVRISVLVVGLSAVCALAGWAFDVDALRRVIPDQPFVRFDPALCFALFAVGWFVPGPMRIAGSAFVGIVGLATLTEYAFDVHSGIDELVVSDPSPVQHPGRMAVATATCFVLLATTRIAIDVRRLRTARWCASLVVLIATLTLLAYAYDVSWLEQIRPISGTALDPAGSLLLLGAATLATLATVPPTQLWTLRSDDPGAILLRRLLPVALVGLPVLGALALLGQRHGLWRGPTTAAVIVIASAVVVGMVTWAAAKRLSRIDQVRAVAIGELLELKAELEELVDRRAGQLQSRHDEIAVLEDRQRIAADLHDIVIQRLFAAGMFLQGGAELATEPETRHRLETAVEAMDAAIKDLRASIFELGGRRTMPTDLTTAIDDVCVDSARMLGFMPELTVDDPHCDADRVREDLLAVLREALANVARHARASTVSVVLRSERGAVSLTVTDDGIGMAESGRSSGTRNMVERARAHGGDCSWTAACPRGTRVQWYLPPRALIRP